MAKYYKWHKREEEVLRKRRRTFMLAIRTPKHGLSGNTWAYINLQTIDDDFERIWITTMLMEPEELPFARATKEDKKYLGRYLKGNKGKVVTDYFKLFGSEI